jgi:hypothetical protein
VAIAAIPAFAGFSGLHRSPFDNGAQRAAQRVAHHHLFGQAQIVERQPALAGLPLRIV